MTKYILALTTIFSWVLWAAPNEYFVAILKSDTLKKIMASEGSSQILSIKKTMTYRCLGCFDFDVTLQSSTSNVIKLATRFTQDGKIEVHLR